MSTLHAGLRALGRASHKRLVWGLLGLTALALLGMAFFYQYVMDLQPCVMCIYIRMATIGVLIAALIGFIAPHILAVRWLGLGIWAVSIYYGVEFSRQLYEIQNPVPGEFGAGCSYLPNFPEWMPLHEWFPGVLMPNASCSDPPWTWLGLSMAEWTLVSFSIYALAFVIVLISIGVNRFTGGGDAATAVD